MPPGAAPRMPTASTAESRRSGVRMALRLRYPAGSFRMNEWAVFPPMITLPVGRRRRNRAEENPVTEDTARPAPLTQLAEDELIFRESVRQFADARVRP